MQLVRTGNQMNDRQMNRLSTTKVRTWADRLGLCLSLLCLIHCILTPIMLLTIPSLVLLEEDHAHEWLHRSLFAILPLLAIAAFIPGYRRHRDARVFYWGVPGLALLATGVLVFEGQMGPQALATIAGSLFLIRAHILNRHLCACCENHHGKAESTPLEKISL
ncbi:MAG: MerC domain-containing protein [Bdellovibrionota bacterium]